MKWNPPKIKAKCERIKRPNGTVDVVCKVPKLEIMAAREAYNKHKEEEKGQ